MKVTLRDYVVCGTAVGLVLALSVAAGWLLQPWSRVMFGDYHVLVDLVFGLYVYGALSGILVRVLLLVKPLAPGSYEPGSGVRRTDRPRRRARRDDR
jgi:hypothetical protein